MQTEEITIKVSSEIAESYRRASQQEREKYGAFFSIFMKRPRLSGEKWERQFKELTGRTHSYAKARGLTPEKLEDLLNEK